MFRSNNVPDSLLTVPRTIFSLCTCAFAPETLVTLLLTITVVWYPCAIMCCHVSNQVILIMCLLIGRLSTQPSELPS
jgi:hypothetical protein